MTSEGRIQVVLKKSLIGGTERQRATVRGLGLRRIGDRRILPKTSAVLGMLKKVSHLVAVEKARTNDGR
jgi:large subunit ribosomal protein L30